MVLSAKDWFETFNYQFVAWGEELVKITQTEQREEKKLENAQQERYQVGIALGLMTKQGL